MNCARISLLLIALVAGAVFAQMAGCGDAQTTTTTSATNQPDDSTIDVLVTTGMIGDIVRAVGGEHVNVTVLMGAGVDPHMYRPRRNDMTMMLDSDVVFYNGLNLEGRMSDLFVRAARNRPVYAVTEEVDLDYVMTLDDAGYADPHLWMDPNGWEKAVDVAVGALSEIAPQHEEDFTKNAVAFREQLDDLDAYAQQCFESIPHERRVIVTAHDAFNYMARAYGLDIRGIQGISTESQAGLKRINELVDLLVERKIPAVFTESSVSDKDVLALISGAASRGHEVVIGGQLFSDAMGEAGTYEGTYIGMIDHNITTITRALGGEAPTKGMQGKLGTSTE